MRLAVWYFLLRGDIWSLLPRRLLRGTPIRNSTW